MPKSVDSGQDRESFIDWVDDDIEPEEAIHERLNREQQGNQHDKNLHQHHHHNHHHHDHDMRGQDDGHQHRHHNHHHHHHHHNHGHRKEIIKPDRTVRLAVAAAPEQQVVAKTAVIATEHKVVTAVDEEQLQKRLLSVQSSGSNPNDFRATHERTPLTASKTNASIDPSLTRRSASRTKDLSRTQRSNDSGSKSSGSASSSSTSTTTRTNTTSSPSGEQDAGCSPPPTTIIIPGDVVRSISSRRSSQTSLSLATPRSNGRPIAPASPITREQLEYGRLLKSGEVQVLYRSPESEKRDSRK